MSPEYPRSGASRAHLVNAREVIRIPQSRARRELRSLVRRELPHADIEVLRFGEVIAVLVSPQVLCEYEAFLDRYNELTGKAWTPK